MITENIFSQNLGYSYNDIYNEFYNRRERLISWLQGIGQLSPSNVQDELRKAREEAIKEAKKYIQSQNELLQEERTKYYPGTVSQYNYYPENPLQSFIDQITKPFQNTFKGIEDWFDNWGGIILLVVILALILGIIKR